MRKYSRLLSESSPELALKRLRIDTLYLFVANRCRTQSCMMSAVSQLQIARQEVYQASFAADAARTAGDRCGLTATLRCQQYAQRWTQNAEFSSLCARLRSEVTLAQSSTQETVFARQLVAYKLAVMRNGDSSVLFCSPVDCTTRFKLGHKGLNQYGFCVMLTPEDALLGPVHPAIDLRQAQVVILRVIVSGCGVRLDKHYVFPELTPVAVHELVSLEQV